MRKTLSLYGVRAESEIQEIQRIAAEVSERQAAAQPAPAPLGLSQTGEPQLPPLEAILQSLPGSRRP